MKYFYIVIIIYCFINRNHGQTNDFREDYKLVWSDEFNYLGLPDSSKWSYDTLGNSHGWGNNEKQYYTSFNPHNAWVENGFLTITAHRDSMCGKEFTSARLISKFKGDWLYGRFEIRAKNPTGPGTWPAIWMLSTDGEYGRWPRSGEIDIMENVGYDPDTIVGSSHSKRYNHMIGTQKNARIYCPQNYNDFVVYKLEWEPEEWRLYVDNKHYFTYKNTDEGFEVWPYNKRFYMILNLAIGGNWGGRKGIDRSLFPHKFLIDYVRVYQKS